MALKAWNPRFIALVAVLGWLLFLPLDLMLIDMARSKRKEAEK